MTNEALISEWVQSIAAAGNEPYRDAVQAFAGSDFQPVLATLPAGLVSDAQQQLRLDLAEAAGMYAMFRAVEPDLLGGTDHRSELKRLQQETTRLMEHINRLPRALQLALTMDYSKEKLPGVDLNVLASLLVSLREQIRQHLEKGLGKPRPGLKRPVSRTRYMETVIGHWERYTGQQAGYTFTDGDHGVEYLGPFLDFADAVVGMTNFAGAFKRRDFVEQIKARRARAEKPSK